MVPIPPLPGSPRRWSGEAGRDDVLSLGGVVQPATSEPVFGARMPSDVALAMSEQETRRDAEIEPPQHPSEPSTTDSERAAQDRVEQKRMMKQAGKYSFIGIEFGVSVVIGYFIGSWLDSKFDTSPWLTLVFILLGLASASRDLFRLARRYKREQDTPNPP